MSIRYTFLVLFLSLSLNITAQIQEQAPGTDDLGEIPIWVQLLYGESPQPEEVIAAYEAYYEQHPFVKNGHTQYYKHWLRNLSRDVNGTFTGAVSMRDAKEEEEKYLARSAQVRAERGPNSAWACIGPYDFDQEAAGRSYAPGSAHVYTIEKAPSNPNIVYAGTATAGLFKSTDNGISWTLATRDVMVNGIRAIEIDPNDENTIFFGAAGSLYKSTDGGSTWNVVGDAAFQNLSHSISDIVARPGSSTDYFLCSDQGLYYTSDAGSNWALLLGGDAKELEFHPTNANIVYFVQRSGDVTEFYKSTDEGVNWTLKPTGWPAPDTGAGEEQKRTEIAVSPAQPGYVYALATGVANGGSGLYGVYISTDEGETWSFSCCGPQPAGPPSSSNINMMGWSDEGLDNGGQYYYDLAFAVSPTQADSIHVGGVNHWVSADGGTTFTCPSKWSHPHKPQYVHADIHDIRYYGSELWVACDGGLFYSNDGGANFTHRMVGIEGTDFWGFGAGFRDGEVLLGGTYHNGTLLKDNNVYINDWICTRGGDNVRGFVNPSHDNIVYDDGGKRILPSDRTLDFAEFSFSMRPNASYIVGRSSNIAFHSYSPNVSYSGVGTVLWKTENDGSTFVQIYDFGAGNELGEIRVAPSDPNTIYVATHSGTSSSGLDKVWRSTDGGSSFTNISPLTANVPYSITVDGDDAQTLWAARTIEWTWQGYLNGNKVFKSTDGGNNWTNISGSALNGEYLTNILHQKGTDGGVYVATRRAVYYKNNTMSDFALFNNNLPASTTSTRLVANYGDGKLYNGTNRSVYKVDFYEDSEPIAQIAAEKFEASCLNEPIQFFSNSAALRTASYSWSFPGGTPSTSTQRDPIVLYDTEGTYDVTLTVTDANGTDTQTLSNFITVYNACSPETVPGKALSLTGASSDYGIAPAPGFTTNHYTVAAWIKRDGDQADWAGIVNTRPTAGAAALNFGYNNQLRYHWGGSSTWGWNSGLIVPDNEWTHIALVVEPDKATIYMNGVPSVNTTAHAEFTFDASMYIGADEPWSSRRFKGLIDEVMVFDRALSQDEIRQLRHLTQVSGDPNFRLYYQFNEDSGMALNRANPSLHCTLSGAASRTTSTAPVAGGTVAILDCSTSGVKDFAQANIEMKFPASGTYPNGDLAVFQLNLSPDQLPTADTLLQKYWIVNNYGSNSSFSELEHIIFKNLGYISSNNYAAYFKLYKRASNAEGNTWTPQDQADTITTGANGNITFSTNNGITSFSQFVLTSPVALPVELIDFSVHLNRQKNVEIRWSTASELNNDFFVVERSRNGVLFEELTIVPSLGNGQSIHEYNALDSQPLKGTSFYRLKQVDYDGAFSYSDVKSITIEELSQNIIVYPNPVGDDQMLFVQTKSEEEMSIIIYDSSGKKLKEAVIQDGYGEISLEGLPKGVLIYQVRAELRINNGFFIHK